MHLQQLSASGGGCVGSEGTAAESSGSSSFPKYTSQVLEKLRRGNSLLLSTFQIETMGGATSVLTPISHNPPHSIHTAQGTSYADRSLSQPVQRAYTLLRGGFYCPGSWQPHSFSSGWYPCPHLTPSCTFFLSLNSGWTRRQDMMAQPLLKWRNLRDKEVL